MLVYNYMRYFNLIWRTPWDFLRLVFTSNRVVVGVVIGLMTQFKSKIRVIRGVKLDGITVGRIRTF